MKYNPIEYNNLKPITMKAIFQGWSRDKGYINSKELSVILRLWKNNEINLIIGEED